MNFRTCIAFFGLLLFCGTIFSQEKDSLSSYSYEELDLFFLKYRYSNPKTAKLYADVMLRKAIVEKNYTEEHNAYLLQAQSESYFGNISKALALADKSIAYAKQKNHSELYLKAIGRKGTIFYNFGKYDEATVYYLQLDSIARASENLYYQIYSNQSIGAIKTVMDDHQNAAKLFLKNEKILKPLKNDPKYATRYLNTIIGLCSAYTYFDIPTAEKYLLKIKEVSTTIKDKDALGYYYTLKGIIFYLKNNHTEALEVLEKADSLITIQGRKRSLFPVYRFQGKAHYALGHFEKTITVYEKIKVLRKEIDFDHFKYQEVISTLAHSYDTINNIEKAIENFTLVQELVKANDTIKLAINSKIKNQYDNKIFQDKIDQLTRKSQKKEQQNTSLIYLSIGLVVIILLMFLAYKKYQKSNKKKFDLLLQKLQETSIKETEKPIQKTINQKQVPDEKIAKILTALQKFETTNSFLNQNTSLSSVAKKLNTNTSYLSKTINTHKELTFINYITKLRIDYALQNLKNDKVLRSYSIKAIAKELGFKSEGAFSRAFKKQTGIYPSFFIKNLTSDS